MEFAEGPQNRGIGGVLDLDGRFIVSESVFVVELDGLEGFNAFCVEPSEEQSVQ